MEQVWCISVVAIISFGFMLILLPNFKYFFSSVHWDPWGRNQRQNPGSTETNDEAIIDFTGRQDIALYLHKFSLEK